MDEGGDLHNGNADYRIKAISGANEVVETSNYPGVNLHVLDGAIRSLRSLYGMREDSERPNEVVSERPYEEVSDPGNNDPIVKLHVLDGAVRSLRSLYGGREEAEHPNEEVSDGSGALTLATAPLSSLMFCRSSESRGDSNARMTVGTALPPAIPGNLPSPPSDGRRQANSHRLASPAASLPSLPSSVNLSVNKPPQSTPSTLSSLELSQKSSMNFKRGIDPNPDKVLNPRTKATTASTTRSKYATETNPEKLTSPSRGEQGKHYEGTAKPSKNGDPVVVIIPEDLGNDEYGGYDREIATQPNPPSYGRSHITMTTQGKKRDWLWWVLAAAVAVVCGCAVVVYFVAVDGSAGGTTKLVVSLQEGQENSNVNPTAAPILSTAAPPLSPPPTKFPDLTKAPSQDPTSSVSLWPSPIPTRQTSVFPSTQPSGGPSQSPTWRPSAWPSQHPSSQPSRSSSVSPSRQPSVSPSSGPTMIPSSSPSAAPTVLEFALRAIISDASQTSAAKTLVRGTPQFNAFQWLLANTVFSQHSWARILQRYALAVFYHSTNGSTWNDDKGWLLYDDECTWFNFRIMPCTFDKKEMFGLDLRNWGLTGTLPDELGMMSGLRELRLSGNNGLMGSVPALLGKLKKLQVLLLDNTRLSGNLPPELGQATELVQINFSGTPIQGQVPEEIGNLPKLDVLKLSNTNMYGNMPGSVCDADPPSVVEWNCPATGPCSCCTYCCYVFIPACFPVG